MTPQHFYDFLVDPAIRLLAHWPGIMIPDSDAARVMVMTIPGQETKWTERLQLGGGPARGYSQFEGMSGGFGEVWNGMPRQLELVCSELDLPYDQGSVFQLMAWNDLLGMIMTRFLLWIGRPDPLPQYGDVQGAYQYYDSIWRPGVKRPADWPVNYAKAVECMEHSTRVG